MELYVIVAGHTDSLKRWESDLTAQFLPTYKDGKKKVLGKLPTGEELIEHRRLLVAPVQLYKIAFAKEELPKVMTFVGTGDYILKRYPKLNVIAKFFRKLLKLKPVPKAKFINPLLQPNQLDKAVSITPIGIKDDMMVNGEEQI